MDLKTLTTIMAGTTGLNTVVDPVRLPFNSQTGISDLAAAVNITIDRTGRPERRDGYNQILPLANCHSLFCDGKACLFVADDELSILESDYSRTVIRSGMAPTRVDYAQVNNAIYYVNGSQIGIVEGGVDVPWVANPVVGEIANKVFAGPILGEHIAFYAGRLWIAQGNNIVLSEPYAFSWYDLARSIIPFDSRVLMIKPVSTGVFVSTETHTFFIKGSTPGELSIKEVAAYPAIEWSVAIDYVEGLEIGLEESGKCALWASPKGACLGTPSGVFNNLTRAKVIYPTPGASGSGLLRGYNFIHNIGV